MFGFLSVAKAISVGYTYIAGTVLFPVYTCYLSNLIFQTFCLFEPCSLDSSVMAENNDRTTPPSKPPLARIDSIIDEWSELDAEYSQLQVSQSLTVTRVTHSHWVWHSLHWLWVWLTRSPSRRGEAVSVSPRVSQSHSQLLSLAQTPSHLLTDWPNLWVGHSIPMSLGQWVTHWVVSDSSRTTA